MEEPNPTPIGSSIAKRAASIIAAGILFSAVATMSIGRLKGDAAMEGGGEMLLAVGFLLSAVCHYCMK